MLDEVLIKWRGGGDFILAEIIGQLAVHEAINWSMRDLWTVTDINSGYAVCHFTAYHVAINFATRANLRFDFVRFQKDADYRRAMQASLGAMVFHPAAVYSDPEKNLREQLHYATWDEIDEFRERYSYNHSR